MAATDDDTLLYDVGNDDIDDDDDEIEISPDHPAMRRVQEALKRQLLARKEKIDADLRIKKAQLKDARRRREDVGVSLYTAQTVLAKAQAKLESIQDSRGSLEETRGQAAANLDAAKELHANMTKRRDEVKVQMESARQRSEQLRIDARATREKGEEAISKLKQGQRAAAKAKKNEQTAETEKQKQDLYVDRLAEEVKAFENEIKITKTHHEAQAEATQASLARLNEAQAELDQLAIERREINTQWERSLFGLRQRSEARSKINQACAEKQQELWSHQTEINSLNKAKQEVNDDGELLELRKRRLDTDVANLKRTIAATKHKAADVQQEYSVVTRTLHDQEKLLQRAKQTESLLASENSVARKRVEKLALRKTELLEQELSAKYNQDTLSKAGRALIKEIGETRRRIADIDMRMSQTENKSAREAMKLMGIKNSVAFSEKRLDLLKEELQAKEKKLNELELQSRRDQVVIDKKEVAIRNAQQQLHELTAKRTEAGAGRADISPQELERDRLREDITTLISDNIQTEQKWLQQQSDFVELTKDIDSKSAELDELHTRNAVFQQKKFRMIKEIESTEKELGRCKLAFSKLQNEVVKLNTLINKNSGAKDSLESNNELMEAEFIRRLRDEELESIQTQTVIEDLVDERARLEQDLVDAEREILEWEKKIQLAQEMKQSLMGDEDSNELGAMKKEIHRMQLRLDQLSKQREILIQSMERSVERRGDIHTKAQTASKNKNNTTQNTLKREVHELQKRIKRAQKDADQAESSVEATTLEITSLKDILQDENGEIQHVEDQLQDLQSEVGSKVALRDQNRDRIMEDQYLVKHLTAAKEKRKVYKKSPEQYDEEISGHLNTLKDLNNVVAYLGDEFPHAVQPLSSIRQGIELKLESVPRTKA